MGIDFIDSAWLRIVMDHDRRKLIDHLGSELAAIMEDASVDAALLRRVDLDQLDLTIKGLADATANATALTSAMSALLYCSTD